MPLDLPEAPIPAIVGLWAPTGYPFAPPSDPTWRILRLDEPASDRVTREVNPIANTEFLDDVRPVTLDGLD